MKIWLPGCYTVSFTASLAHWTRDGTHHGPQSNPAVVHLSPVKLGRNTDNPGTIVIDQESWNLVLAEESEAKRVMAVVSSRWNDVSEMVDRPDYA